MSKKLIRIKFFLKFSLIFLLFSCNDNSFEKKSDRITLTFWHTHNKEETSTLEEIIRDYESQNHNIKVELQQIPFSDAQNKYKTVAQAKNAPDLFRAEIAWTAQFASLGYLMAIDNFLTEDLKNDFLSAPLKYNYYDGHYWGIPQVTDCLALFYNKKIFKESGLKVPETTEELIQIGKKLTNEKENKYAFFYRGDPYWYLPFLWSFGGGMVSDNNEIQINNEGSINALKYLIDLRTKHKIVPNTVDFANDYDNQQTGFKTGKYAMIINGPWATSDILDGQEFKNNPDNLGIARIPAGKNGFASPVGGHNYVISSNTKYFKETWELVKFLSLPKNQEKFALKNNLLPTRKSTYDLNNVKNNHLISDFKNVLEAANNRPVIPQGSALFVDMKQPYQSALLLEKSPEQALNEIAKAWEKLLKNEN